MEHMLFFTERSLHTAYFECNLDISGYVLVNMPVGDWKKMGCPHEIVFSMTPIAAKEQAEDVVCQS